jgi:hypothetical protein
MLAALKFLWTATTGHRLRPWRSPFLRWRIETYSGIPAESVGFREFWRFTWNERKRLRSFLSWVEKMNSPPRHKDTKRAV